MSEETGSASSIYAYDAKRQWRSGLWKKISARTVNPRDARVVYLAGPNNFDAWEAEKNGFRRANMIAVERDEEVARHLRASGVRTVKGKFWEVALAIASEERIDVLLGDFVSGITDSLLSDGSIVLALPTTLGAVVALNLQRGRENPHHVLTKSYLRLYRDRDDFDPHRGKMALWLLSCSLTRMLRAQHRGAMFNDDDAIARQNSLQFFNWWNESARSSYRAESGHLVFDSVVFTNKHSATVSAADWPGFSKNLRKLPKVREAIKHLAAAKAVYTAMKRAA